MAHGIDVSNNNGAVDWTGVAFAFLKATEGTGYVDKTLAAWRAQCADAGVEWGAYHFAHPDQHSAQDEAAFFLANAPKGTIAPALDFETRKGVNPLSIMGVDAAAAWINEWCSTVNAAWNQVPFFYSFRDYMKRLAPLLQDWPLWLASASGTPGTFTSFAGRPVAIEQWGIVGGVDQNESYFPLSSPLTTAQETDDMAAVDQAAFDNMASQVQQLWDRRAEIDDVARGVAVLLARASGSTVADAKAGEILDALAKRLEA